MRGVIEIGAETVILTKGRFLELLEAENQVLRASALGSMIKERERDIADLLELGADYDPLGDSDV